MARKKIKNLDVIRIIKRAIDSQDFLTRQEKLSRIFPRTIDNIKPINADGKTIAMDDAGASIGKAGFNVDIQNEILDYVSDYFIGYQACAILKQNAFIDRACSIPAKDAIAPDYKISYLNDADKIADGKTKNIDELKEIKRESYEKYKINEICIKQNQNKKVFGYSVVVPIVQDADMEKPFNIDGIKPGSYKGLTVIEPYWITPELDNDAATNPASKHYYLPTYYRIQGKNLRIHRSWVIRSVNSEVPDILKPVYFFGGVPLTQQIYKRVYASEKVANEAPMLAMSKRLLVADANILNMVANPEEATATLKALTEMRDNWGIFAKNPGDQVQQIDTSLADFDALIMTQYQLVASIAGMPATKLLKTTPKGFNSTGEFEERDYKQSLIEIQENDYKPIINLHNTLYTKSRFGRVIPLQVEFNPIDTPSEREKAEIGNIRAMIAASNIANGITTANEERKILKSFEGSEYSGIEDEPDDGSLADEDDENASNLLKELYGENNEKQAETDENLIKSADLCKKNAKNDLKDEKTNAKDAWITIKPNGEENEGRHLWINENETPKQAIERTYKIKLKDRDGGQSASGEKTTKSEAATPTQQTQATPASEKPSETMTPEKIDELKKENARLYKMRENIPTPYGKLYTQEDVKKLEREFELYENNPKTYNYGSLRYMTPLADDFFRAQGAEKEQIKNKILEEAKQAYNAAEKYREEIKKVSEKFNVYGSEYDTRGAFGETLLDLLKNKPMPTETAKQDPAKTETVKGNAAPKAQYQKTANETFADYAKKFDDANVTPDSILNGLKTYKSEKGVTHDPEDMKKYIKDTEEKIAKGVETVVKYRLEGSRNTAVYTPERKAKHKEIIDKLLKDKKPSENPTFILLGGRGGSGKSKFNGEVYNKEDFVVLDADKIKEMFEDEYKGWNAAHLHEESADILDHALMIAKEKGLNVVLDATMNGIKTTKRRLDLFKDAGYHTEMHYMFLPRQKAAQRAITRAVDRPDGRYVPIQKILDMQNNEKNFDELKQYVDAYSFSNNDVPFGEMPVLVEKKGDFYYKNGGKKWI